MAMKETGVLRKKKYFGAFATKRPSLPLRNDCRYSVARVFLREDLSTSLNKTQTRPQRMGFSSK